MIQQQMQLHRTFGATKVRPVEHAGTQIDHGGVHADQLVLEAKLVPPAGLMGSHGTAFGQHLVEHVFIKLPRAVLVGVGQRGARGSLRQA